ncbi:MAG: YlxR family protein, partial [Acidimicrobiales bacterium]
MLRPKLRPRLRSSPRPRPPTTSDGATGPGGPARTCVGCRRRAGQAELVRVVLGPDGSLLVGRTLPGRGAWLCAGSLRCVQRAAQRNALTRALAAP